MTEYLLGGTTTGSTTLSTPTVKLTIIFSGQIVGATTLSDTTIANLTGTIAGETELSEPDLLLIRNLFGTVSGSTSLAFSYPLPIHGMTTLSTSLLTVDHLLPPVNDPCVCNTGKSFRWGHVFSRGDLPLYVMSATGEAFVSPYEVTFAMFLIRANGVPIQVGPSGRRPVMQGAGEYYATGTAGEAGQPGDWQIRWTYRKSFNGPAITETHTFRVVDSISDPIPGDPTCRQKKYGWS